MPLFVVIAIDPEPHNMARRNQLRPAHRQFVTANDEWIRFAAAMTDDEGNQNGSLYVFEATSEQDIRRWMAEEPFFSGNVYHQIRVERLCPSLNRLPLQDWPG